MNNVVNLHSVPKTAPVYGLPDGDPTFAGFQWFVANSMGVPPEAIPDDSFLQAAYAQAVNIAYTALATVPYVPGTPNLYAIAVYNLAAAMLLWGAIDNPDAPPPYNTFWTDLRTKLGIYSMSYGLVNSAADQGTSESMYIPEFIKGMNLLNLQLMKSPWGQMYLMIAGEWGTIWGLTI
jgi:hypothetical protein